MSQTVDRSIQNAERDREVIRGMQSEIRGIQVENQRIILNPVTSEGIHQIAENLVVGAIHELPLQNRIPLQQSGFGIIRHFFGDEG